MNSALKIYLDNKVKEFNTPDFIAEDPVSIPHLFSKKQDIEIAGFFAAVLAWGNRKTIINKCRLLLQFMDNAPHDFCLNHSPQDLKKLIGFCHRTFNDTDLLYCIHFLQQHYQNHYSLEQAFFNEDTIGNVELVEAGLTYFHHYFFSLEDAPQRTRKHIASPQKNSACKRLNMFLRWMIRVDNCGVDFGIWNTVSPAQLICPVDVHVARVATRLGLMEKNKADWKSAMLLTCKLCDLDPHDPVKYDFALFGLGIYEKF